MNQHHEVAITVSITQKPSSQLYSHFAHIYSRGQVFAARPSKATIRRSSCDNRTPHTDLSRKVRMNTYTITALAGQQALQLDKTGLFAALCCKTWPALELY